MDNSEKIWQELTNINVKLARLDEQMQEIRRYILGNGNNGLEKRVKRLEGDLQRRVGAKALWELVRSVITFLIGGGIVWIILGKK